jgi:hypothetical protein
MLQYRCDDQGGPQPTPPPGWKQGDPPYPGHPDHKPEDTPETSTAA